MEKLLTDYNIPFITEGHGHTTDGWVNVHCPFCSGAQNFHLGISKKMTGCHCWRCGGHSIISVLNKILNLPEAEVKRILVKYRGGPAAVRKIAEPKVSIHPFKFPHPYTPLNFYGKQYLRKRNFDPEYIEKEWGLLQTGPVSFLDSISYNHRILIPIFWNDEIVSFQSRDISGKSNRKYLACPMKREEIHHKNILYGKQEYWKKSNGIIVVEGVTDVWRFGFSAAATFETSFKMEQVLELAKHNDKFFIVFDNEPQAQEQAQKLMIKLKALGKKAYVKKIKGNDPGDMDQEAADHFVKSLIK
jgi:hypothetical protein